MLIMVGHDTKDKGETIMIECARSLRLRTETKHDQKSYTVGRRSDFRGQAGQVQCACALLRLTFLLSWQSAVRQVGHEVVLITHS